MNIPALPFAFEFELPHTALVLIDFQRDFMEPGELVIDKPGKGAFYATGLHEMLQTRGITHLVFTGVTTEVCVQSSLREANDRGYDCLLLEDCTESYFPAFKAATLAMVHAQGGIVGWTAPSAALLAAMTAGLNAAAGSR